MTAHKPQVGLVLAVVFMVFVAQMTLNPIIAPLAREVGLAEWQIGVTISTAAIMVVATSQMWGRRSQAWGRKPVLVAAFTLALIVMTLFVLTAWLGIRGALSGAVLFALFVLLRGIGFGSALAAVPPTAQAYIANVTTDEKARVKGMAGIGAAQGMAMVGGALLGGLLAGFGVLVPVAAVVVILAVALVLVVARLHRETPGELIAQPPRIRPTDTRVWPYLVAGFGMFTALGFIQVLAGFLVQDRLGLSAEATGQVTGGCLLAAGIGMIVAQVVVVPRSGWHPVTLLRVGGLVATLGFAVLVPAGGLVLLVSSMGLIGLGLGIAMPGYSAGPSLLMRPEEQGGLAGLIGATNGLTFVVAPTLGTALYGVAPVLPVAASVTVMALVTLFVWLHPRFGRTRDLAPTGAAGEGGA